MPSLNASPSSSITISSSDCDIYIKGVTRVEAIEMGFGDRSDTFAAIENIDYSKTGPNYVSQGYNPTQKWVDIYESDKRIIYLIWDDKDDGFNDKTSDFPTAKWKAVTAHEFGHAFGFEDGHNTVETLMWPYLEDSYPNYTTPTVDEINHLKQIYGADKY